MNLAIRLSLSRILLSFVFMAFISGPGLVCKILALSVFIVAAITDIYDGRVARARNMVTPLGVLLDPLADKILIASAFISFVGIKEISLPAWMVIVIISREFLILGLRLLACGQGKVIPAEKEGKQKTILQMALVIIILLYLIFRDMAASRGIWREGYEVWAMAGINTLMAIALIAAVYSGCLYFYRYREFLK